LGEMLPNNPVTMGLGVVGIFRGDHVIQK